MSLKTVFFHYRNTLVLFGPILLIIIFSFCFQVSLIAQSSVDWKVNGNNVATDSKIGTNTQHDIIFETNNAERFRLTKDGKLGLGMSDPDYKLDMVGDLRILGLIHLANNQEYGAEEKRFTYVDQNGTLKVGGSGDLLDYVYRIDCRAIGDNPMPAPVWQSKAGEDYGILFTATGCPARVGIATNEPKRLLDVRGKTYIEEQLDISNIAENYTNLDPAKLNIYSPSDAGISVVSMTSTEKSAIRVLRYDDTSKSIFNLSSKGYIALNYFASNGEMPFAINRAGTNQNVFRVRPEGGIDLDFTGSAAEIAFAVRNSTGDLVDITGDGKIWCQGILVKYAPFWPDYVFDKGYELLPLSEVEDYIEAEGHLPGVPSAFEITEKGVDLYEATRVLLEKVEELTLYIIKQEKEIQELRANQNAAETTNTKADNSELPAIKGNKGGENE